jgi:hypothetical protein
MKQPGNIRDYLKTAARTRAPAARCLDEEKVAAFYSGLLNQNEADRVRDHLVECTSCLALAREARQFLGLMSEPLDAAPAQIGPRQVAPAAERARFRNERPAWWKSLADSFRLSPVLAALLVVVFAGSIVLIIAVLGQEGELRQLRAVEAESRRKVGELERQLADERTRSEQLAADLRQRDGRVEPGPDSTKRENDQKQIDRGVPGPDIATANIATFLLSPALVRDPGQETTFTLAPDASAVKLRIALEGGDYKSYAALLTTADGDEVWTASGLRAQGPKPARVIVLSVPASRFVKRDYVLKLTGLAASGAREDVEQYAFRVLRK